MTDHPPAGPPEPAPTVLFLCTGNYYRSRFAEALFNALAAESGMPWRAVSRGLAIERGVDNIGPMSQAALARLTELAVGAEGCNRMPLQAVEDDLRRACHVIALKEAEHSPLLCERFPGWEHRAEFWHIHDTDCGTVAEALAGIEREVRALVARLAADLRPAGA